MKTSINLLPWKYRRARLMGRRAMQWSALWSAVAIGTLAAYLAEFHRHRAAGNRLAELQAQYEPIAQLAAEIQSLQARQEELAWREAVLRRLEDPRPALSLLGLISASARQCGGGLRVEKLTLQATEAPESKAESGTPTSTPPSLAFATLKGIAVDSRTAARFVLDLQQTGAFDRVELKEAMEQAAQGRTLYTYCVECSY